MAYTRAWNSNTPLGSLDADQIDDSAREKLVDIEERMADVLGADGDWTTDDPVIPATHTLSQLRADVDALNGSLGSATGIKRAYPWSTAFVTNSAGTVAYHNNRISVTGASALISLHIPLVDLPVGVTVTEVGVLVGWDDADHTIAATFRGTNGSGDVTSVAFDAAISPAGSAQWWNKTVTQLIAADVAYHIELTLNNNNMDTSTPMIFYQARVVITHPGGAVR